VLSIGASSIAALVVAFPSTSFIGISIVGGLFGTSSDISISITNIIAFSVLVPLSVVLLETSARYGIHIGDKDEPQNSRHSSRNSARIKKSELASIVGRSIVNAVKQPVVWAPLLALLISLLGGSVPEVAISSLNLVGSATSGIGIFVAGLALAVYRIKLNRMVFFNVLLKSLVQPALMIGIIFILGLKGTLQMRQ
jgi:predicted permease